MAQEAKVLARQRAELEAQLAAERDNAQSHGYNPTPLATPKAQQVTQTTFLFALSSHRNVEIDLACCFSTC